jgi:hypothetical protein
MTTRRDGILAREGDVDWVAFERSIVRVSNKHTLAPIMFRIAAEAPQDLLERLFDRRVGTDWYDDRWQVEKEPWIVEESCNIICGIWASQLTGVCMRLHDGRAPLIVLPEQESKIQRIGSMEDLKEDTRLLECWQRTEWWLKKTVANRRSYAGWSPLHILVLYSFPNFLIWFAAKLFPEDLRKSPSDCGTSWGLPIHFCSRFKERPFAAGKTSSSTSPIQFSSDFHEQNPEVARKTSVILLAKLYPEGLLEWKKSDNSVDRNGSGVIPLHSYLQEAFWTSNAGKFQLDDVQKMVQMAPESLLSVASFSWGTTRFFHEYPFMIAASLRSRWCKTDEPQRHSLYVGETYWEIEGREVQRISSAHLEQLTAIYWVLRQDPSALQKAGKTYLASEDVGHENQKKEYLKQRVAKYFGEELYFGTVAKVTHPKRTETKESLFTIDYDDGDCEDFDIYEVNRGMEEYKQASSRKQDDGDKKRKAEDDA